MKNLEDRVISLEERMVRMNLNKVNTREPDFSHLEQKFLQMMSVYKQSMEEKEELLSNKIEKILVNMKENIPSSSRQPHDCKINLERIESLIESEIMKRQKAWIEVSEAAWNAERNCNRVAEEMIQKTEEIDNKLKALEIKMNSKETDWSIFDVKLDPKEAPLKTADLDRKSKNPLLKHREQSDSSVDYSGDSPSPSFGERHFAKFSSKKAGKKTKSPKGKGRVLTVIYKQPRFSGRRRNLSGSSDS